MLFLDGSMCLAGRRSWSGCLGSSSWRHQSEVTSYRSAYIGRAIVASAYEQGIGVTFKQPVIILHVSFRAVSTCLALDFDSSQQLGLIILF